MESLTINKTVVFLNCKNVIKKVKTNPTIHSAFVFSIIILIITVCTYAQINFSRPYSIFKNTISDQGSLLLNPRGQKVWNLGIICAGILFLPHVLYLSQIMCVGTPIASQILLITGSISSITFSFVGIFPAEFKIPHCIFAGITFVGICLVANIYFFLNLKKLRDINGGSILNINFSQNYKLEMIFAGLVHLFLDIALIIFLIQFINQGKLMPISEWAYLLGVMLWMITTTRSSPITIQNKNKSEILNKLQL
ncbi:hypothetical protein NEF87_004529 [Candidatus Lokiarchaeum ossiferum]|uniref:DUF998 domain-containing protein n=1 Tax=Candidatus Lokiarchaeum ossiferum TaxID=2951803 RepID=A0ABY6I0A4_9ARCH|nr:hypothetical protein NEF87_004529 [Candidatus Lokiarchaeum sp. B-35]